MGIRRSVIVLAVLLLCWAGGYAFVTRDPDRTAYREMCLQSAQSALDGLNQARRVTEADLLTAYQTAMLDDAQKMISQARSGLAAEVPPDDESIQRRDTLLPLLDQAERVYEDIAADGGPAAAARAEPIEEQLRAFIEDNA